MITVRLKGGLGNQMFQYAAGLRLARKHATGLKLDLADLSSPRQSKNFTPREYALDCFHVEARLINENATLFRRKWNSFFLKRIHRLAEHLLGNKCYFDESDESYDESVLSLPENTCLNGYFQDERYFKDIESEVRQHFRFRFDEKDLPPETWELAETIRNSDSTCVHVRRGDYLSSPQNLDLFGVCTEDFFRKGLELLRGGGRSGPVFVFSQDEEWCRSAFAEFDYCQFVDSRHAGPKDSHHLWLMSQCRNFVISNSSFAWWAAWLCSRPGKRIYRPSPWFRSAPTVRVCPVDWFELFQE